MCVCSCVLYFRRNQGAPSKRWNILLQCTEYASFWLPVPAANRVHIHLYITILKLRCTQWCRKTRLWPLASRVKRNTKVHFRKAAAQSGCPGEYSLVCACYGCVKKIVARATHGEVINMKPPPPPRQTSVNTIKGGRGVMRSSILNMPTSVRAINGLRLLLHLTGHYTCHSVQPFSRKPYTLQTPNTNKSKEWAWANSIVWQDPSSGRIYPKLNVAFNGSTTEVECDKAINATSEDSF